MQATIYYLIGIQIVILILTMILIFKMFSKFSNQMVRLLEQSSKLIRDIEKYKQSLLDEIVNVSKAGDSLKTTLQTFKLLEKTSNGLNNIVISFNRCLDQFRANNNSHSTNCSKLSNGMTQLKNKP